MESLNGANGNGHVNGHAEVTRTSRVSVLDEAKALVDGDRARDYGPAKESFERIAKMWSVVLNAEISPRQVALCLMAMKLSREAMQPKHDNLVDFCGYALLLERLTRDE